jgi:hypothetical protein
LLEALFAIGIAAIRFVEGDLARKHFVTSRTSEPETIPAATTELFRKIVRIAANFPTLTSSTATTTGTSGKNNKIAATTPLTLIGPNPKIVTFAPVIVPERLVTIHTLGIQVGGALLTHHPFRGGNPSIRYEG